MIDAAVLLIDPKYPHNVGAAVRACAVFGAPVMRWTGERLNEAIANRLPREERLKDYRRRVDFAPAEARIIDTLAAEGLTPVAVEARRASESLHAFIHPARALYVFGPEDGSIPRGTLGACHRFVRIPSNGPLNLAAAINVVLYDRALKRDPAGGVADARGLSAADADLGA